MNRPIKINDDLLDDLPSLPLEASHWQAVVRAMKLSPRQAEFVELVLRGASDKQIAAKMIVEETTIRTYFDRVGTRTRTHGRMELALHVLAVSHEVSPCKACPQK